ncbi:response regulator protein VraR [Abditibacteriota bacterium]|nr:response regulator protein VraR [Abditibacteriota bacterium]
MHAFSFSSPENLSLGLGAPSVGSATMNTTAPNTAIRVLLVEDYDLVRRGLELLLGRHPFLSIVGAAATRSEALRMTAQEKPDVVLLDLQLGEDDGLEMLPELLELGAKNVIVFTATADSEVHHSALALGAKAVVEKGQSEEVLSECIQRVHAGETLQFEPESVKIARLSKAEREVVALLCAGAKDERILGQLGISSPELSNTLKSAQNKLEVADPVALVVYAFRHGLARSSGTE